MKIGPDSGDCAGETSGDLIPGLPNDVAELCLLRLPFPHFSSARYVSSAWDQTISNPSFLRSKSDLHLSHHHLFVLTSDSLSGDRLQWLTLDPRSRRWSPLPPMPGSDGPRICGASLACAADSEKGEIYVIGGMRPGRPDEAENTAVVYSVAKNSWRVGSGMRRGRSYFSAAAIGGMVYAAGGGDGEIAEVERYDPARDRWDDVAPMRSGMARYDAAVIGGKMLVTEGWTWPFGSTPRGRVYDAARDAWEEMSVGLREGWTGVGVVARGTLFVVSEYGDGKAYDPTTDTWARVAGGGVPAGVRKPYAVAGAEEGRIYVIGDGMDVGVGSLVEEKGRWKIEWEVVEGPLGLMCSSPCTALVLYA